MAVNRMPSPETEIDMDDWLAKPSDGRDGDTNILDDDHNIYNIQQDTRGAVYGSWTAIRDNPELGMHNKFSMRNTESTRRRREKSPM